jgi:hypothetical protein
MESSANLCPGQIVKENSSGLALVNRTGRLTMALLLAVFCCALSPQGAMGFGFGAEAGIGSGRLKKTDHSFYGQDITTSFHEKRRSAGLVYDTNVGQDRVFNYRLGISYQHMEASSADESGDLHGISFDNDFGFALVSNKEMRLWIGPEVKVELIEGDFRSANSSDHTSDFALGVAPVVGLNVHLDDDLSITLKGGYMFLEGIHIFSDWEERYGFFSIGIIHKLGGDRPQAKEGKP